MSSPRPGAGRSSTVAGRVLAPAAWSPPAAARSGDTMWTASPVPATRPRARRWGSRCASAGVLTGAMQVSSPRSASHAARGRDARIAATSGMAVGSYWRGTRSSRSTARQKATQNCGSRAPSARKAPSAAG